LPTPLPIDEHLPAIADRLLSHGALVLSAPPGTGKTTRVPGALVDRGIAGEVVVLEPRRLAARAAAARVAAERGVQLGAEVGYVVRHDARVSDATRIRFVTEGVLVRRLVRDPFLEGVAAVVLDEFHERHLETDLALAMLAEVRDTVRPDLRLLVMSATLDVDPLVAFLGQCPVVQLDSPLHPVQVVHDRQLDRRPLSRRVAAAVARALAGTPGDVLVFLPGVKEIAAARAALSGLAPEILVVPLHGKMAAADQDLALARQSRRRVVLATNIAETSLTIEGVTAVVDSGLARHPYHDPGRGLDVLRSERISRASAEQRRGRAGRTAPGICYRLWTAGEERGMAARDVPEIQRVDLAGAALEVRAFAGRAPAAFGWFERPRPTALERADALLEMLGAIAPDGTVTAIGRSMLHHPLHPRLARVLVAAKRAGCQRRVAGVVAVLAERDVFAPDAPRPTDVLELVRMLERLSEQRASAAVLRQHGLHPDLVRSLWRLRDRLAPRPDAAAAADEVVLETLLLGFPDRVARRVAPDSTEAVMVGGRGLVLSPEAAAGVGELFLALQTVQSERREQTRTRVVLTAPVERAWLERQLGARVTVARTTEIDERRGKVVSVRRVAFFDLVLEEARGGAVDHDAARELWTEVFARDPWSHVAEPDELRAFLARVAWLRGVAPQTEAPALDDAAIARVAAAVCAEAGVARPRGAQVLRALEAELPARVRAALDRMAPARVRLPSGQETAVDYTAPAGPTIAVAIQQLFGQERTPRIGATDHPLVVALLAPNRRPVQITQDLASFWRNVYPSVRSELRRRYPRHAWPEDPLTAQPTHRPRPR
jgi:ATP-dependent helicase HrpB